MGRPEEAKAMFLGWHQCAQSVVATFSGGGDLPRETLIRLATPFGAGCGRLSQTCGAVTGALMVIGLKSEERNEVDLVARESVYRVVNEFCRRFRDRNGSLNCGELLGLDLSTEEGRKMMAEKEYRNQKCAKYVLDAGELLEELGF